MPIKWTSPIETEGWVARAISCALGNSTELTEENLIKVFDKMAEMGIEDDNGNKWSGLTGKEKEKAINDLRQYVGFRSWRTRYW